VALITTVGPAHLENFGSVAEIADVKSEIFSGLEPDGVAIVNRDSEHFDRMRAQAARSRAGRIVTFGRHPAADWRLAGLRAEAEHSEVEVLHGRRRLVYRLGVPGEHVVMNSLAVLAATEAVGADVGAAAAVLADLRAPAGRGERRRIALPDGSATLLDESYNANPASMRAALAVLGQTAGRRIAVLGDMLELGPSSGDLHADLASPVEAAGVDLVFTCGPQMQHLHDALPAGRRGCHAADSAALAPALLEALRPGDAVLVKGSLGSRMARVVTALLEAGPAR
jgi:UDP-N-acetylmuramoyl-tripeptide--D-alanyl-D-alanine ligase